MTTEDPYIKCLLTPIIVKHGVNSWCSLTNGLPNDHWHLFKCIVLHIQEFLLGNIFAEVLINILQVVSKFDSLVEQIYTCTKWRLSSGPIYTHCWLTGKQDLQVFPHSSGLYTATVPAVTSSSTKFRRKINKIKDGKTTVKRATWKRWKREK